MTALKWILGVAVLWVVCLVAAASIDPSRPPCGGVAMAPGDRCDHYQGSSSWTTTYDDEVASSARWRAVLVAGVVAIPLAGGAWLLATSLRRRRGPTTRTPVSRGTPVAPPAPARARPQAASPRPQAPPAWQASEVHGGPIPPAPSSSTGEPRAGA